MTTLGYFGKGRRGISFPGESSASKRRRLDEIEDGLIAAGQPEVAGLIEGAADLFSGDQLVPQSVRQAFSSRRPTSGSRRPRQRRFKMARRFRRRKGFKSKVKSVILSMKEGQRLIDSVSQATFTCGDGTTRVLYISDPLSTLTTGSDGNQMAGNDIWLKAFWLRGRIALDQTTNTLKVRLMLLKTRQFADLPAGFTTYGNTTTALTNPTQTAEDGERNIAIFESTPAEIAGQPSARYVGNSSGIDIVDNDNVTVIAAHEHWMSPDKTLPFKDVDMYVPINRRWKKQSDFDEGELDAPRSLKGWNYYWTLQVFSNTNANNILVAQDILGTFDIITYFKEL